MSLNKRTYTNQQTVITAENLNEIQDAIIYLQEHSGEGGTWGSITGDIADQTDLNAILAAQSSQIEELEEAVEALDGDAVLKSAQATKTSAMTTPVGIDANGKLWSVPGGSGGGGDMYKATYDPDDAVADAGGIAAYVDEHGGGSSDYTDLTNKPKINNVELSGNKTASALGFADVATSGSYNDLDDKPTIPTVPTNVSAFTNDAGYLTEHQDISGLATKTEVNAKYTKPSAGIPKTDLASAVQTSLGLADTAVQPQDLSGKQDTLISGTNIKTVNGYSILGSGNLNISSSLLKFENTSVPVSAWASDSTYDDFPYRASIALQGVTAAAAPHVVLNVAEAISGNYAPVSLAYNGGVYIYASEVPEEAITIPSIICM